jgi:hypothetical protein
MKISSNNRLSYFLDLIYLEQIETKHLFTREKHNFVCNFFKRDK